MEITEERLKLLEASSNPMWHPDVYELCLKVRQQQHEIALLHDAIDKSNAALAEAVKTKEERDRLLLQKSDLEKILTELLDCLETTGNWTESGDSVALWLTLKEEQRLDEIEERARQILSGVPEKPNDLGLDFATYEAAKKEQAEGKRVPIEDAIKDIEKQKGENEDR